MQSRSPGWNPCNRATKYPLLRMLRWVRVAPFGNPVVPEAVFDPVAVLETVQEERCTSLYGVPTMFIAELAHPNFDSYDLASLRTGVMAGSPCPVEVMKACVDRMHMDDVTICYGMTETSPVCIQPSASIASAVRAGSFQ